jgi:hypothetical protein
LASGEPRRLAPYQLSSGASNSLLASRRICNSRTMRISVSLT